MYLALNLLFLVTTYNRRSERFESRCHGPCPNSKVVYFFSSCNDFCVDSYEIACQLLFAWMVDYAHSFVIRYFENLEHPRGAALGIVS